MVVEKNKSRKALGKGLNALIPASGNTAERPMAREFFRCPIEKIKPHADQPRQHFDDEALQALVESIREKGIIQPLVVRRNGDSFELIAGERRWRASQLAGIKEVPVVVREASTAEVFELALVENIQREDLNPIEEAEAFNRLVDEHGYSQVDVADLIGRDRSTVSNSLRLLGLPLEVKSLVVDGALAEGHARALLQAGSASKMIALARQVASKGMSVRETERRARALSSNADAVQKAREAIEENPDAKRIVEKIQRAVGAKVNLVDRKGKGRIEISFGSYEELDAILNKILV